MKVIWSCLNFGKCVAESEINVGDPIINKISPGVLHEITLLSGLDIPDLEAEQ